MTMSGPTITITVDAERDIDRFIFFLTNEQYRVKRRHVLQFYSSLRTRIEAGESAPIVARSEVLKMYERFAVQLQSITTLAKKEFSESDSVFATLAETMDFPQLATRSYIAVPTFLPFSPLEKTLFYFSIAMEIAGRPHTPNSILVIGVHEISHFIFSEQYKTLQSRTDSTLNDPAYHFMKEAITAAVMNQQEFKKYFDYPSLYHSIDYPGNAELRNLFIEQSGGSTPIISYIERKVLWNPNGYSNGLDTVYRLFISANEALSLKWKLWNNQPNAIHENPKWLMEYKIPIKLPD